MQIWMYGSWMAAALAAEPAGPELGERLAALYPHVERLRDVKAEARDGVVTLSGRVPSTNARDEAERIAAEREGVWFVDNRLEVDQPTDPGPVAQVSSDDRIEEQIRAVFSQVDELARIELGVESGVVHLGGRVLETESREQALALVRGVEGVVFVDDDIEQVVEVSERLGPAARALMERLRSIANHIPLLLVGVGVVAIGWAAGRGASALAARTHVFSRRPLLGAMFARVLHLVFVIGAIVLALQVLDATALVGAVLGTAGIAGLAVGFAFKDIVENYLAGILLSLQQPFSKNDLVHIGDTQGVVVRLTMRNTLLLTLDGNNVYLPNAMVFNSALTNFTRNPKRRFDFQVGVSVDEDLSEVIRVGVETLRGMEATLDDPPPHIWIDELGESNVVLRMYAWVDQRSHEMMSVRTEAIRQVKDRFDEVGFDMPEPIYRVSLRSGPTPSIPEPGPPAPRRRPPASAAPVVPLAVQDSVSRQADAERDRSGEPDLLQE
ncbi:MAG: mechanosensitive ion channel [Deltaproteobacteria bacterium]|nr:mechanosensitive ion channel [Deltaproteobacteria bacterium]